MPHATTRTALAPTDQALDRAASLQLIVALARAYKAIDDYVRPRLSIHGLSMTEFAILEVLHHRGPLPLGQLASRILVTGASTTYTVKNLESRGLIRRRTSTEDQRIVFGELTSAGRKRIEHVFPLHSEDLRVAMSGLSRDEKRKTSVMLRKLLRHSEDFSRRLLIGSSFHLPTSVPSFYLDF